MFDVEEQTKNCIEWIRNWFNGKGENSIAIIGISGGIDSTTTGKLLVEALGKERVVTVQMPCGIQDDMGDSDMAVNFLNTKNCVVNICDLMNASIGQLELNGFEITDSFMTNTPARLRMTVLYGISACIPNSYVVNTCNLSETAMGYDTMFGDNAGAMAPIANFTKTEVRKIAKHLGVPKHLYEKTPIDGMSLNEDGSYMSDEDKLGITYKKLDSILRDGGDNNLVKYKMLRTMWKRDTMRLPSYNPNLPFTMKEFW